MSRAGNSHIKKKIYLYPITEASFLNGGNNYIQNTLACLNSNYCVVNSKTRSGIIDMIIKMWGCDYLYLNWIEDTPDKRFGYIQSLLFIFIVLPFSRLTGIKIVWFIHNNLSHSNKNFFLKKMITRLMVYHSSIILAHSKEITIPLKGKKVFFCDHPVEKLDFNETEINQDCDLLVWGKVSSYKGVYEFVKATSESEYLSKYKITIAGKFSSQSYYEAVKNNSSGTIKIINEVVSDEELERLFAKSKYVLFTYTSLSLLSSAALSKTLSYKKLIIGPNRGAFKELGEKGLIFTYNDFNELELLLKKIENKSVYINISEIEKYLEKNSWDQFSIFLAETLN